MFKITFTVNGECFDAGERDFFICHGHPEVPFSYAFFCPRCGAIWARVECPTERGWQVMVKSCGQHGIGYYFDPPGSIWLAHDLPYIEALPTVLLKRELLLHCDNTLGRA